MSIEKLKKLFGNEEVMLELVEAKTGELVLRNGLTDEAKELIKIEFHPDVREVLGDQIHTVAQHMMQAVLFNLLEKQLGEWHANIVDEPPQHYS